MKKPEELSKELGLNFDEIKDVLSPNTLNNMAMSKILGGINVPELEESKSNKCRKCDGCGKCSDCDKCAGCTTSTGEMSAFVPIQQL